LEGALQAFPTKRKSKHVHPLADEVLGFFRGGIGVVPVAHAWEVVFPELGTGEIHSHVVDSLSRRVLFIDPVRNTFDPRSFPRSSVDRFDIAVTTTHEEPCDEEPRETERTRKTRPHPTRMVFALPTV